MQQLQCSAQRTRMLKYLVQDVQDDVVSCNQRGREHGILVLRYCKSEIVNSLQRARSAYCEQQLALLA